MPVGAKSGILPPLQGTTGQLLPPVTIEQDIQAARGTEDFSLTQPGLSDGRLVPTPLSLLMLGPSSSRGLVKRRLCFRLSLRFQRYVSNNTFTRLTN